MSSDLNRLCRLPPARRQHGLAMMEVLVSILIFAFGLLGLIGLEASAIHYSADAEDRNRAALFAGEIASSMWINNSVSPTTAQKAAWATALADPTTETGLPGGTFTIVPSPNGATNSADITISWTPKTDKTSGLQNANLSATRQLTTRVILP
jgi:type IV pilus assembly protein PilV